VVVRFQERTSHPDNPASSIVQNTLNNTVPPRDINNAVNPRHPRHRRLMRDNTRRDSHARRPTSGIPQTARPLSRPCYPAPVSRTHQPSRQSRQQHCPEHPRQYGPTSGIPQTARLDNGIGRCGAVHRRNGHQHDVQRLEIPILTRDDTSISAVLPRSRFKNAPAIPTIPPAALSTPGVTRARERLEEVLGGCEVYVFHATGSGGRALERLPQH
jgi:hypothetical protein